MCGPVKQPGPQAKTLQRVKIMRFRTIALICACLTLPLMATAVGVSDNGTYKVYSGERAPAEPWENVRIVPPPLGGILKTSIRTDRPRYHVGDQLQIFFGVNKDAYVYIFETDAAGLTHQLFPNYYDTQNFLRAGKQYYIPDRGYDLEITGPSGNSRLTIIAVMEEFPFLAEYRHYTREDPYPASREGGTALVRRIESFRSEPSAMLPAPVRPVPRDNVWATDDTTFYVMDRQRVPPPSYKVPRYGWLEVDTYPSNARIYIDSDYFGRSPQVIDRLEIGYHHILLEKEGYEPYECNVYIKGNETKHLDIFMKTTPYEPGFSRSENPATREGIGFFSPAD